jgi:hypothetical protein
VLTRRNLLTGLGAVLITAPAIVHAGNIMRVRSFKEYAGKFYFEVTVQPNIDGGFLYEWNELGYNLDLVKEPMLQALRHASSEKREKGRIVELKLDKIVYDLGRND